MHKSETGKPGHSGTLGAWLDAQRTSETVVGSRGALYQHMATPTGGEKPYATVALLTATWDWRYSDSVCWSLFGIADLEILQIPIYSGIL